MKIAYFWLTSQGKLLAENLQKLADGDIFEKINFKNNVKTAFKEYDALIFIMATGIVVRIIAPLINHKSSDPAILVLDQNGKFVISLLSGHLGGANELAYKISDLSGAIPVITTATDTLNVCAFDMFAKETGSFIENIAELKYISSDMVEEKQVDFITPFNINCIFGNNVEIVSEFRGNDSVVFDNGLYIKNKGESHVLYLRPKNLILGIGCKRNTEYEYMEKCMLDFMKMNALNIHSLKGISTIFLKKEELSINKICDKYNLPLIIVADEDIKSCGEIIEGSDFVESITGVRSVCEASSYIASGRGNIICGKTKYKGITFAISREEKTYGFNGY